MQVEAPKTFAEAFEEKLKEEGKKPIDLEKAGVTSRQNVSRLIRNTPHSVTGAPPKAERETVIKIATFLNWDVNDALLKAGHSPMPGTPAYEDEVQTFADELAKSVRAAGYDELEDEGLRADFLADMRTIAESMIKREIEKQSRRKKR